MKRILSILALLSLILASAIMSACGEEERVYYSEIPIISTESTVHQHSYSSWLTTSEATCVKDGERVKSCSCGDIVRETITNGSHTVELIQGYEPTCTEEGLSNGKVCTSCGVTILEQSPIEPRHTEVLVFGKLPTCTEAGVSEGKKCTECDEILVAQTPVEPKGHSYENGVCTSCGVAEE